MPRGSQSLTCFTCPRPSSPKIPAPQVRRCYLLGTVDQTFLNILHNVADFISETTFFGMLGWFYILKEIFMGEAGGAAGECSQAVKEAFNSSQRMS